VISRNKAGCLTIKSFVFQGIPIWDTTNIGSPKIGSHDFAGAIRRFQDMLLLPLLTSPSFTSVSFAELTL
jgi:hypothetical protein